MNCIHCSIGLQIKENRQIDYLSDLRFKKLQIDRQLMQNNLETFTE